MKHPQALSTLRIFISALALISLLPAGYTLVTAGYLPARYLWIALPLYTAIILAASIVMMRAKLHRRSVAFVSAAVLLLATVINIGVYMAMRQTTSFMSGIQQAASAMSNTPSSPKKIVALRSTRLQPAALSRPTSSIATLYKHLLAKPTPHPRTTKTSRACLSPW
jgi:hypothetical protein